MGLRPAWGSPGVAGDALGPSSTWHDADAADAVLLLSAPHPSPCIGIMTIMMMIINMQIIKIMIITMMIMMMIMILKKKCNGTHNDKHLKL